MAGRLHREAWMGIPKNIASLVGALPENIGKGRLVTACPNPFDAVRHSRMGTEGAAPSTVVPYTVSWGCSRLRGSSLVMGR